MDSEQKNKKIMHLLSLAPHEPGVYLMQDSDEKIIYVGKAGNLKRRLSSYFVKPVLHNIKGEVLVKKISSFEIIITRTEKEALILESNLIKKYRPRYNVILKDDKRYPSLRLDTRNSHPYLSVVRKIKKDGALYFGPFASSGAVRQTLNIINKIFKLRKCKTEDLKKKIRPCLNYQLNLCMAPCCFNVKQEEYFNIVNEVILFLKGNRVDLIKKIKKGMHKAAEEENFEKAAELRDKMFAIEKTVEKQVAVTTDFIDRDVLSIVRSSDSLVITLLNVRKGYLIGTRHFSFAETISTDAEVAGGFIRQYYEKVPFIPKEILVPTDLEDYLLIEEILSSLKGAKVSIHHPQRGQKADLVKMAYKNAVNRLNEIQNAKSYDKDLLLRIQRKIKMDRLPCRIECFDNANISGTNPVSAMVVFENGRPKKSLYRKYAIKGVDEQNDYAYMAEVLQRRFGKGEDSKPYPDILLLDGGRGQISTGVSILKDLNIEVTFEILGIAKKNEMKGETKDKIYKNKRSNPLIFKGDDDLLLFFEKIRDEAHRFATSYHKKRRLKTQKHSALDEVPGIGDKKKKILLKHFKSIKKIQAATLKEISALPGISQKDAKAIVGADSISAHPDDSISAHPDDSISAHPYPPKMIQGQK